MFRTTQDYSEKTLVFIDDAEDGGCLVICSECAGEFNTKDAKENHKDCCPHCGADLVYPGWAEW